MAYHAVAISHLCGSSRGFFFGFYKYFCRRKALVVLRKVYVLIAVNTVPLRSSCHICGFLRCSAAVDPQKTAACTAQLSVKGV